MNLNLRIQNTINEKTCKNVGKVEFETTMEGENGRLKGEGKRRRGVGGGDVDELTRADKARVLSPLGRYRGLLGTRSHPSE